MELAIENVWDYPRPPRVEPVPQAVAIVLGGVEIARSLRAMRVLETSHPPTYYLPAEDFLAGALEPAAGSSICEWKGAARYWTVLGGGRREVRAGWSYPVPTPAFAVIAGHVAVYPGRMERCSVGGVEAVAQPGDFYGGWITPNLRGPFKGAPGTLGW